MHMNTGPHPPVRPYDRAAHVHAALADAHRLEILMLLASRPACVCELVDVLPLSQPAVSQHLRRLREVGLVREERRGRWVVYALAPDLPPHIRALLAQLPTPPAARRLLATTPAAGCRVPPNRGLRS